MKFNLLIFFILISLILNVNADTFTDNFDRPNSSDPGNGWAGHIGTTGISYGINSNQLYIYNGSGDGDNFAYYDLNQAFGISQPLENATVSGKMYFDMTNGSTSFYMALNATKEDIETDRDGGVWYTDGKGYGIQISGSNHYYIMDEGSFTGDSDTVLDDGTTSLSSFTNYEFELIYAGDDLEVRFWEVGSSRPTLATISYSPSSAPQASGTNITFGITDEGYLRIDDLMVTTGVVPEPSTLLLMVLSFLGLPGFTRKFAK